MLNACLGVGLGGVAGLGPPYVALLRVVLAVGRQWRGRSLLVFSA
jgi:hypothetical protein